MKKSFAFKRLGALALALLMVVSLTCTALAASKTVNFEKNATVEITTGKGLKYFFGKKTTVTFTNTGKKLVNLDTPAGIMYTLDPGQSRTFSLKGNGKKYTYKLSRNMMSSYKKNKVEVETSAGSIS